MPCCAAKFSNCWNSAERAGATVSFAEIGSAPAVFRFFFMVVLTASALRFAAWKDRAAGCVDGGSGLFLGFRLGHRPDLSYGRVADAEGQRKLARVGAAQHLPPRLFQLHTKRRRLWR